MRMHQQVLRCNQVHQHNLIMMMMIRISVMLHKRWNWGVYFKINFRKWDTKTIFLYEPRSTSWNTEYQTLITPLSRCNMNNQLTNSDILLMSFRLNGDRILVGLSDKQVHSVWRWADGTVDTLNKWLPGQPKSSDGHCAVLVMENGQTGFRAEKCRSSDRAHLCMSQGTATLLLLLINDTFLFKKLTYHPMLIDLGCLETFKG